MLKQKTLPLEFMKFIFCTSDWIEPPDLANNELFFPLLSLLPVYEGIQSI